MFDNYVSPLDASILFNCFAPRSLTCDFCHFTILFFGPLFSTKIRKSFEITIKNIYFYYILFGRFETGRNVMSGLQLSVCPEKRQVKK